MRNSIIINEKDNVIVAVEEIKAKTKAVYEINGKPEEVEVKETVPMYHKIARRDIEAGEKVIKYGEYIGEAARKIPAGTHVHTHNVLSAREKIVDQEGT